MLGWKTLIGLMMFSGEWLVLPVFENTLISDFTGTRMPQKHLWLRVKEPYGNSVGWQEIIPQLSHRFRISEILPIIYFRLTLSLSKMRNVCAQCMRVCICVCVCVIQKQFPVTRASITGRMSAGITAHCLQWNLSVSCKRWWGRRRKVSLGSISLCGAVISSARPCRV